MDEDDIIVLGDQVELALENNRIYKTKIEDMTDNGLYFAAVPSLGAKPAPLYIGDKISLGYYRSTGRFSATMEVVAFEKQNDITFVWLMQKTAPVRQQRRDAYRLRTSLEVQVFEYTEDLEKYLQLCGEMEGHTVLDNVTTRDVSVTGIALRTKRGYEPGEKYLLRMRFPEQPISAKSFLVCAEVVRSSPTREKGANYIGMRFIGVTNNMSDVLSKYVFTQQQILIKQKKLVDIG